MNNAKVNGHMRRQRKISRNVTERRRLFLEALETRALLTVDRVWLLTGDALAAEPVNSSTPENEINKAAFTVHRVGGDMNSPATIFFMLDDAASTADDFDFTYENAVYHSYSGAYMTEIGSGKTSGTFHIVPIHDGYSEETESVNFKVIDASAGYSFDSKQFASATIFDHDAKSFVTVTATDNEAHETGSASGTYTVSRFGPTSGNLVVNFSMSGTAQSADYQSVGSSVTIPDGQTSATVTLTPVDDSIYEQPNETATLTLSSNSNYTLGKQNAASISIIDNDLAPVGVSIENVTIAENSGTAKFKVSLVNSVAANVLVSYETRIGTAGTDDFQYTANGSATITGGNTYGYVEVPITNDGEVELDESFGVRLKSVSANAAIIPGKDLAVGTITNDDLPKVSITAVTNTATEGGSKGRYRVARNTPLGTLSVGYGYESSSTAVSSDYFGLAASGTIGFVQGVTDRAIEC